MSCGPAHAQDCAAVLDDVYEYLHNELDVQRLEQIRGHLQECPGCLEEFGVERLVRDLLHSACHCTPAPDALRQAILSRIGVRASDRQQS